MRPQTEDAADDPGLSDLLTEIRAETERLQAQAKESTELRLKWERQRTTDRELIRKLDSALVGEITWLDVMSSKEYQAAHAAEFDEAMKDYERREKEGTLPSPDEARAQISEFMDTMRSDVATAEQADALADETRQLDEEEHQQLATDSPFAPPSDDALTSGIDPVLIGHPYEGVDMPTSPGEYGGDSPFRCPVDEHVTPVGALTSDVEDQ